MLKKKTKTTLSHIPWPGMCDIPYPFKPHRAEGAWIACLQFSQVDGRTRLKCHARMKKWCPTCPWFRIWKTTLPSVSGRTTTARAGIRARWQVLHSVTSAVLPLRHRSWKSWERSRCAHEERLLPEMRQNMLMKQIPGGVDASGSTAALIIPCRAENISWASSNYSWLHNISHTSMWSFSLLSLIRQWTA